MKIAATGGPSTQLCTLNTGIISRGGAWSRDGIIIFNNGPAPLYRVPQSGGDATVMGQLGDGETGREFPAFLPDGRHFLYHAAGSEEKSGVFVASLDTGETRRVIPSRTGAIYDKSSGHLLFVRQGTTARAGLRPETFALTGDPFPVAERVESSTVPGLVAFSLSDTGVLAYGIGEAAGAGFQLTWVDRAGKVIGTVGPEAQYRGVTLSPDGSQVAAHRHDGEGGDIWVSDLSQNRTTRLTFEAMQENSAPVWSPVGDRIAFSSTRDGKPGISIKSADNTGVDERVFETSTARWVAPFGWSPDGRSVLFSMPGLKTSSDLWMVPVSGERKAVPLLQSAASEGWGQISPDGKWLAYTSTETGPSEVYVQPASLTGGKWAASIGGGNAPRWRGDSQELDHVANGKMWAVGVTTKGTAFVPGTPKPLFDYAGSTANLGHGPHYSYAVTKDGKRFLVSGFSRGATGGAAESPIVVVLNWVDGIKK